MNVFGKRGKGTKAVPDRPMYEASADTLIDILLPRPGCLHKLVGDESTTTLAAAFALELAVKGHSVTYINAKSAYVTAAFAYLKNNEHAAQINKISGTFTVETLNEMIASGMASSSQIVIIDRMEVFGQDAAKLVIPSGTVLLVCERKPTPEFLPKAIFCGNKVLMDKSSKVVELTETTDATGNSLFTLKDLKNRYSKAQTHDFIFDDEDGLEVKFAREKPS